MQRTRQEVESIVAFWWKMQVYRRRWLERKRHRDSVADILRKKEIREVKKEIGNITACDMTCLKSNANLEICRAFTAQL